MSIVGRAAVPYLLSILHARETLTCCKFHGGTYGLILLMIVTASRKQESVLGHSPPRNMLVSGVESLRLAGYSMSDSFDVGSTSYAYCSRTAAGGVSV